MLVKVFKKDFDSHYDCAKLIEDKIEYYYIEECDDTKMSKKKALKALIDTLVSKELSKLGYDIASFKKDFDGTSDQLFISINWEDADVWFLTKVWEFYSIA